MKKYFALALVCALVLALVPSVALADTVAVGTADDFKAAINNSSVSEIQLTANISGNGFVINRPLTIDFNGYTYTVSGALVGSSANTQTLGTQILNSAGNVTFKNGTLTSSSSAYKPSNGSTPCRFLIQNYANLTLDNMTVDGSECSRLAVSINSGKVTIKDTDIQPAKNGESLNVCSYASYTEPNVTIEGDSTVNGNISITNEKANSDTSPSLTIKDGTFTGTLTSDYGKKTDIGVNGGEFSAAMKEDLVDVGVAEDDITLIPSAVPAAPADVPETGDHDLPILCAALALLAFVGMAIVKRVNDRI